MTSPFAGQASDLQSLYRDPSAPKDVSPADTLHQQTTAELAKQAATAGPNAPVAAPAPAPVPPADSTKAASPETASVLDRFKPLGIASMDALRGKTDAELRNLSGRAVAYELRQQSLAKSFAKNADGSWDFTHGPDGTRTGLDAAGKPLPPGWEQAEAAAAEAAAQAAAPAEAPASSGAPAAPSAPRPATSPAAAPRPVAPVAAPVSAAETRVTNRVVAPAPRPAVRRTATASTSTVRRIAQ